MASVTESTSTSYNDANLEDHIRSPFQLNKNREKPVKLVSLTQTIPTPLQQTVKRDETLTETSSDTTEPTSPSSKSSIGSSPFSLNIKKVSKSSVSSPPTSSNTLSTSFFPSSISGVTTATLSSTSSLAKTNLKESEKIVELQKEIHTLEKEIEAKDAKLSSTLKSIKQFWSPELKKERGARKEETEKCVILKEKYQIATSEIEEYKNALTDLESEFKSQEKTIHDLNDKVKAAQQNAKKESEVEINLLKDKLNNQSDELFVVNKTLDDLESKYNNLEEELEEKNKCISDLEIILVDHEKKLVNYEADQKELEHLKNVVNEQEIDYQILKKDLDQLKAVNEELNQEKTDTDLINSMNEKVESLSDELEKLDKAYQLSIEDVEKFRTSDTTKQRRIEELEQQLLNVQKENSKLTNEVKVAQDSLDESESEVKSLQEQLNSQKSSSDAVEQKEKEISNLNNKYEKLDKYLSERENALELCRDELKEVKTANRDLRVEIDTLENQLFEKKSALERFEKQKDRFSRSKEDVALVVAHNELKKKYDEAKEELQKLQDQLEEHEKSSEEKNESIKSLEEQLSKEAINKTNLENEIEKLTKEKASISQELEKSKAAKKPTSDEPVVTPANKQSKKLWDEMAKKDERIEELERQLKEKSKQLSSLKKNQTTEREKQHHLVNESKKVENEIQQLEEEKSKRDQRIIVLEDALRESVTIAVEGEELLAHHKEMYENAVNKANEVRSEIGRVELEKKITNIKNAFLILSLSEKDALIASMEATRKRQMDELFNIKQQRLLDSISEKDNQIAHLELQSSKTKRQDIKQLKMEKERFVDDLKKQNNNRMTLINHGEEKQTDLLLTELQDAPPEQVYEAIRHLSTSTSKLEFYIEEFLSFSNEQYKKALADLPNMPKKKCKSNETLKKLSKPELLKELKVVDGDSKQLRDFVHRLLDKLEGVS